MTGIYSEKLIKKIINTKHMELIGLVSQLSNVDPMVMLDYAIQQKYGNIALSIFLNTRIDKNIIDIKKYFDKITCLIIKEYDTRELLSKIKQQNVSLLEIIYGDIVTDNKNVKNGLINAIISDNEIDIDIKLSLIDISTKKKELINTIRNYNKKNIKLGINFELNTKSKSVKIIFEF